MTEKEIERHKIAAKKLELIKDRGLKLIKRGAGRISEYDVQQFILSEFKKEGLIRDKKYPGQIVAVNENSSTVHYLPKERSGSKIIRENNLILIDIWGRVERKKSPFADITWMAYTGKKIPKKIRGAFQKVVEARDITIKFIKKNLEKRRFPTGKAVDKKVRDYFKRFGLEKYFSHGTGHSLGFSSCHGKYFRFSKKCRGKLKPSIPFTIEPGLYFKGKFGIRSEIDCYISKDYELKITTPIQKRIIMLPR